MTPLTSITGLTAEAAELLSAIGVHSAAHLAAEEPSSLHPRLEVAAWQRGRASLTPPLNHLEQWIAVARMLTPPEEVEAIRVAAIPEAVTSPVDPQAWMPPALRAAQAATGGVQAEPDPEAVRRKNAAVENQWRKVDPSRFATVDEYNEGRLNVQPLSRDSIHDAPESRGADDGGANGEPPEIRRRVQRVRSTGEKLSRWVKRGVVHPRPVHTWLGAVVSLLWRIALTASIAGVFYFVLMVENQSAYTNEVIAAFVILLILGCMQLHFVGRSRCRICSCNLFYSKNCLKNRKAHLIPGLGYVASLALHLLIFGWFRCMYCGTAIRLRPGPERRGA